MRQTARKVKIEDLIHGSYTRTPEGEPNHLITPWDQKLLRVNIIATVVEKFVRDDGGYATLHLDDGTGTIRAKAWSEDVEEMEKFETGDIVRVIGKVREYEGEIHLVPEVLREMEDPNWELLQEVEILENRKKMYREGKEPDYEEKEGDSEFGTEEIEIKPVKSGESEVIGEIEDLGESEDSDGGNGPKISDDMKDKLLLALDKLEGEDGASVPDLAAEIDESIPETEEALGVLLNEDKVYEPVAGKFKRLG